jgi:hypothetical protein
LQENARENLQLAFDVAEKHFGITKLLDLEDMVDVAKPDERSVITYVSQYYHVFASNRKVAFLSLFGSFPQQEVAGRRIGRLVDVTSSNDQLKTDYTERATAVDLKLGSD